MHFAYITPLSAPDFRVSSPDRRTPCLGHSSVQSSRYASSSPALRTPQNVHAPPPVFPSQSSDTPVSRFTTVTPALGVNRERWSSVTAEETSEVMQAFRCVDARKRPLDEGIGHGIDVPARKRLRAISRNERDC